MKSAGMNKITWMESAWKILLTERNQLLNQITWMESAVESDYLNGISWDDY